MNGKVQTMAMAGLLTGFMVLSTAALRGQTKAAAVSDMTVQTTQAVTRTILVSLEDRRLALLENGVVMAVYPVAVGRETTPSPTGTFTIVARVANPTYYHDGKVIAPGRGNPVGTRWMGLSEKGYGIHGTNAPHSIGKAASHGCIRMGRHDLESLFAQVRTGDVVEIVGERDAETAAIFGTPAGPSTPAAAVLARTEPLPGSNDRITDSVAPADASAAPAER